jgi:Family of unknown function (DUF6515)
MSNFVANYKITNSKGAFMKKKSMGLSGFSIIAVALIIILATNINAQERERKEKRRKKAVTKKEVLVKRQNEYRDVVVKDRHYFYREGYFYDRRPEGYVKIKAPIGAEITLLPTGYKVVRVHRVRYYLFGGIYYKFYPKRKVYVVVNAPL